MSEKKEKVKKAHYFTNKEIISMAIMAAAMFVVSCITVPLVLGVPFPGIRCLTCGLFFGIIIALDYAKVPKIGVGTLTTLYHTLRCVHGYLFCPHKEKTQCLDHHRPRYCSHGQHGHHCRIHGYPVCQGEYLGFLLPVLLRGMESSSRLYWLGYSRRTWIISCNPYL